MRYQYGRILLSIFLVRGLPISSNTDAGDHVARPDSATGPPADSCNRFGLP